MSPPKETRDNILDFGPLSLDQILDPRPSFLLTKPLPYSSLCSSDSSCENYLDKEPKLPKCFRLLTKSQNLNSWDGLAVSVDTFLLRSFNQNSLGKKEVETLQLQKQDVPF